MPTLLATLDKETYAPGETMTARIRLIDPTDPAPLRGQALAEGGLTGGGTIAFTIDYVIDAPPERLVSVQIITDTLGKVWTVTMDNGVGTATATA